MKTQNQTNEQSRRTKRTAILYTRMNVQQTEISENSSMYQEMVLREFCLQKNIEIIEVINDFGSGANFNRKKFPDLLRRLRNRHLKADLLLFKSWDRFSRNVGSAMEMLEVLKKVGVNVKAINISETASKFQNVFTGFYRTGKRKTKNNENQHK